MLSIRSIRSSSPSTFRSHALQIAHQFDLSVYRSSRHSTRQQLLSIFVELLSVWSPHIEWIASARLRNTNLTLHHQRELFSSTIDRLAPIPTLSLRCQAEEAGSNKETDDACDGARERNIAHLIESGSKTPGTSSPRGAISSASPPARDQGRGGRGLQGLGRNIPAATFAQ